ncbi:MAG: O-antigen ligase family protein [Planctomycetota bacterium]|jgi:O-antigen ligase
MSGGALRTGVRLLVAAAALAPVVAHLVERGGSDAWLVVALFALPALLARRDAQRLLVVTVALVFVVPLLPTVLRVVPFLSERVVVLGAVAWCAVADLWPRGERVGGWVGVGRIVILGWLGWSVAGAVHGFVAQVPVGSGWMGMALADLPRHMLLLRPQVESTNAFAALWLRFELLVPMWFALELAARDANVLPRLVRGLAWACVLGVGMLFWDFWTGIDIREDYFWGRLKQGIPRNNRPLVDNNALGSAVVLALPLLGASVLSVEWSRKHWWRGALALVAASAALLLLVTTRSKAAFGAFALAIPTLVLVRFGVRRVLSRPIPALVVFGGMGLFVGAQFLPDGIVERVASNRYGADLLRVVQLNVATDYLQANRVGPWTAALAAGEDAPLFGHGLGSLPATMPSYRDPDLETEFNPLSENGHNQWLQSFAEEGLPGALALTSLFVLASAGALRRLRAVRGEGRGEPWLGGGGGLDRCSSRRGDRSERVAHDGDDRGPRSWAEVHAGVRCRGRHRLCAVAHPGAGPARWSELRRLSLDRARPRGPRPRPTAVDGRTLVRAVGGW